MKAGGDAGRIILQAADAVNLSTRSLTRTLGLGLALCIALVLILWMVVPRFTGALVGADLGDSTANTKASPRQPDRSDCASILGTAFRSAVERDWYEATCSTWTAQTEMPTPSVPLTSPTAVPASTTKALADAIEAATENARQKVCAQIASHKKPTKAETLYYGRNC